MEKKMTQHKVIAEDSLSAMDEISKVLGKEAVILKTKKVNGKIEILGSNNIEDIASSNAKKIIKQKSNFSHLFSNHNLEQKIQNRKVNNILDEKKLNQNEHLENVVQTNIEDLNAKYVDVKTFSQFTTKIEKLLKNMVVSDIDELYQSNNKSLTIELLKKGFSKNIISEFQEQNLNREDIDVELLFYHYLAKKLVLPYKDQIADSEIIFINGPSGSGKTTLCSKIASHILDNKFVANEKDKLSIVNFAPKSSNNSELVNFGRLLNLNVSSISSMEDMVKYIDANKGNKKLIVDVSQEVINTPGYIQYLEKLTLNKKCSNLIALPASTNKNMIESIIRFYKDTFPVIGLTKLDEANINAEELSILGELNCKIGILSGSRSIIGSIAFAKREVLAQYMKDMSI
jgi:flagellar biosynthesis protein FlhF